MQETLNSVFDQFRRSWPYRWEGLAIAVIIAAVVSITTLVLPDMFTSSAQIAILQSENDTALPVRNAEIRFLNEGTLDTLLDQVDLGFNLSSPQKRQDARSTLRSRITVDGVDSELFTINCSDLVPRRAKDLCIAVLAEFEKAIAENADTTQLKDQLVKEQVALAVAEKNLQEYQIDHLDVLGQGGIAIRLDAARAAEEKAANDYESARRHREQFWQIWVASRTQAIAMPQASLTQPSGDPLIDRLYTAYASLEDLRARYSEDHPDVAIAKREIETIVRQYPPDARMCSQSAASVTSNITGAVAVPAVAPILIDRQTVDASAANIAVCRTLALLIVTKSDVDHLMKLNEAAPPIEARFAQLTAQRDAARDRVDTVRTRIQDLDVGDAKGLYTVVSVPSIPNQPSSPNRRLWLLAGLVFGILGGALLTYVRGLIANSIVSPGELQRSFVLPFYGTVSLTNGLRSRLEQSAQVFTFMIAVGCLVVVMLALIITNPYVAFTQHFASGVAAFHLQISRFLS